MTRAKNYVSKVERLAVAAVTLLEKRRKRNIQPLVASMEDIAFEAFSDTGLTKADIRRLGLWSWHTASQVEERIARLFPGVFRVTTRILLPDFDPRNQDHIRQALPMLNGGKERGSIYWVPSVDDNMLLRKFTREATLLDGHAGSLKQKLHLAHQHQLIGGTIQNGNVVPLPRQRELRVLPPVEEKKTA